MCLTATGYRLLLFFCTFAVIYDLFGVLAVGLTNVVVVLEALKSIEFFAPEFKSCYLVVTTAVADVLSPELYAEF